MELKIQEKDNNYGGRSLRKEGEAGSRGQVEAKTGEGERDCHCQRRRICWWLSLLQKVVCLHCDIGEGISACIL